MADTKNKAREEVKGKVKKTEQMVRDYTEDSANIAKELTKQVRDSYLTSFKLGLSLWENNLKMANNYFGQWASIQQDIYTSLFDVFNSRSNGSPFGKDLVERTFALQKDYLDQIRDVSEREIERVDRETRESVS